MKSADPVNGLTFFAQSNILGGDQSKYFLEAK